MFPSASPRENKSHCFPWSQSLSAYYRELTQPQRRRHKERHKFAYLTMKNISFARFAHALFIFWHFAYVLVLSTKWNDQFCSCVIDVSIWWQMFNFFFLPLKRGFQFDSRIVKTHFENIVTLNYWETIAEKRSYIFKRRSRCRWRSVCVNSLILGSSSNHGNKNVRIGIFGDQKQQFCTLCS